MVVAPQATLVVLEATGSYWIALAVALHQAHYRISVLNPAQVARCAAARKLLTLAWALVWSGPTPWASVL
jgi:transposase